MAIHRSMFIKTGAICLVAVPANNETGFRHVDLGDYYLYEGNRVLLTKSDLAEKYGHLVNVPIYLKKKNAELHD